MKTSPRDSEFGDPLHSTVEDWRFAIATSASKRPCLRKLEPMSPSIDLRYTLIHPFLNLAIYVPPRRAKTPGRRVSIRVRIMSLMIKNWTCGRIAVRWLWSTFMVLTSVKWSLPPRFPHKYWETKGKAGIKWSWRFIAELKLNTQGPHSSTG